MNPQYQADFVEGQVKWSEVTSSKHYPEHRQLGMFVDSRTYGRKKLGELAPQSQVSCPWTWKGALMKIQPTEKNPEECRFENGGLCIKGRFRVCHCLYHQVDCPEFQPHYRRRDRRRRR